MALSIAKKCYYHFDGLGSVAALSNVNNQVVERYSYDIFGEPTIRDANDDVISASAIGNPYLFTGRRLDEETGLYYYRARYYNTNIGRFQQTDPIGYADGLNLYAYCKNNPINYVDPLGLKSEWQKCIDRCNDDYAWAMKVCWARTVLQCGNPVTYLKCWWTEYGNKISCHVDCTKEYYP